MPDRQFSFRPIQAICPRTTPIDALVMGIAREIDRNLFDADPPLNPDQIRDLVEKMATDFLMSELTSGVSDEMLNIPNGELAVFLVGTVTLATLAKPSRYESRFHGVALASPLLANSVGAERILGHFLETLIDDVAGELAESGWGVKRNRYPTAY